MLEEIWGREKIVNFLMHNHIIDIIYVLKIILNN